MLYSIYIMNHVILNYIILLLRILDIRDRKLLYAIIRYLSQIYIILLKFFFKTNKVHIENLRKRHF